MKEKNVKSDFLNRLFRVVLISVCFITLNFFSAYAQERATVSGVIEDESGNPLIGASVLEKGTTNGVLTNSIGNFTLVLTDRRNPIIVSYIGYQKEEVLFNGEQLLKITIKEDSQSLGEVVVIGYQLMRKSDITGSVASVKSSELNLTTPTIGQSMVGKVSGVQIFQVSGAPYKSTKIRVRGTSSVNAGSDPLYVIDGYPSNEDLFLNPEDIESIEVLKDAASAAIYGSRASGGVILITTKRGKTGKPVVTYDYQYGINQLSKKVDMLNAAEFTELFVDAHNKTYKDELINRGKVSQSNWTDDYFKDNNSQRTTRLGTSLSSVKIPDWLYDFPTGQLKSTGYDTDWQDELYRNAINQRHSISISGGKSGISYNISGGYQNQEGIMLGTDQEKFNFRSNLDIELSSKFSIGTNLSFTNTNNNEVGEGRFNASPTMAALVYLPIFKAYNEDGTPSKYEQASYAADYAFQSGIENPVAYVQEVLNNRKASRSTANLFGQYKINEYLSAKLSAGTYKYNDKYVFYLPTSITNGTRPPYSVESTTAANARSRTLLEEDYLSEFTLNYNQKIGNFSFSGVGGTSVQKNTKDIIDVNANGFTDDKIPDVVGGGADATNFTRNSGTSMFVSSIVSAFGRLNANYLDKYHITASFRGDGCSLFGPANRWGYFPSVSAGWTVSSEEFYKNLFGDNSNFKIRGSWGLSGNNNIGTYNFQQVMGKSGVVIGNNIVTAMYPSAFKDINLGWESTSQTNIGFDLSILNGKFSVIANYYDSYTFNLLFEKSITAVSGSTSMLTNLPDSKINNTGFDVQVDANLIRSKDWDFKVSANISFNKNKVIDLGGSGTILTNGAERSYKTHITQEGEPIGMFYGFKVVGMVNEQDLINLVEDDKYYNPSTKTFPEGYVLKGPARSLAQSTKLQLGDFYFEDLNGDGVVDDNDKAIIGNPYPDFIFGFFLSGRYKNIDLAASFNGSYGNEILDGQCYYLFNMEGSGNQYQSVNDRYRTPENPGNGEVYRAARGGTQSNSTRLSTFYLEDGSYLRCTNITLGYTWQSIARITNNAISNIRFYGALDNPFTFQKYRGYNPEVDYNNGSNLTPGVDYGKYPLMKAFNMGVKVTF